MMDHFFTLIITLIITIITLIERCDGSLYNPHVMPDQGPYFEGWYMRLTDPSSNISLGLMFGSVVPEDPSEAKNLAFLGFLYGEQDKPLEKFDYFPDPTSVIITANGKQVTNNPDKESPADFRWEVPEVGYMEVRANATKFDFSFDCASFSGEIGPPVPWDDSGDGPAGWIGDLPLPLQWFVYSVRSPIVSYTWRNRCSGDILTGDSGLVHMEKNWGVSFPSAWIWLQGVAVESNVTFAVTYGPVDFYNVVTLNGHLIGYKNPEKDIDLSFNPVNSVADFDVNGCKDNIEITIYSLKHLLHLSVNTKGNSTFSDCLYGPMNNGFRKVAQESYSADVKIVVQKRHLWWETTIDSQSFSGTAMEFGGNFGCHKCCKRSNY